MSPRKAPASTPRAAPDAEDLNVTGRDAVRQSQRIASQLHQLIAASITVTTLRNEQEILKSLARSARVVFQGDEPRVASIIWRTEPPT